MNVIDGEFYVGRHGKIRQFSGFVVSSFSDVFTDLAFDPPPPRGLFEGGTQAHYPNSDY